MGEMGWEKGRRGGSVNRRDGERRARERERRENKGPREKGLDTEEGKGKRRTCKIGGKIYRKRT